VLSPADTAGARPTNPAAGNIDVLLAQVRPPISGGPVRMVMCSLNVKPRSHRFRCPTTEYGKVRDPRRARRRIPTPVNRRTIQARSTRSCTEDTRMRPPEYQHYQNDGTARGIDGDDSGYRSLASESPLRASPRRFGGRLLVSRHDAAGRWFDRGGAGGGDDRRHGTHRRTRDPHWLRSR